VGSGLGDPEVRRARLLRRDAAARDADGVFLIEGERMLAEAVAAGVDIEVVLVREGSKLPTLPSTRTMQVSARVFDAVSDTSSGSDLVAIARRPSFARAKTPPFVLVLDGIADPGNVGTLIRSAEAAGAAEIWLVGTCADPWAPKVVRASAGAVFLIPVVRAAWSELAGGDRVVLGLTSGSSGDPVELGDLVPGVHWPAGAPIAVVVGHETRGVSTAAPVDVWVTIAQRGRVESLNAAMAGTVAALHIARLTGEASGK
jgi:TrmH family RNA methyltransferase